MVLRRYSAAFAEVVADKRAQRVAALDVEMAAVLRVLRDRFPFRRQRGVAGVKQLPGEAAVGVLRTLGLHFDAQAAHAVRRPHPHCGFC